MCTRTDAVPSDFGLDGGPSGDATISSRVEDEEVSRTAATVQPDVSHNDSPRSIDSRDSSTYDVWHQVSATVDSESDEPLQRPTPRSRRLRQSILCESSYQERHSGNTLPSSRLERDDSPSSSVRFDPTRRRITDASGYAWGGNLSLPGGTLLRANDFHIHSILLRRTLPLPTLPLLEYQSLTPLIQICVLEALAQWETIHTLEQTAQLSLAGKRLLLYSDNVATVACINKGGRSQNPQMAQVVAAFLAWAWKKNLTIHAKWVPGSENSLADMDSRIVQTKHEWRLNPHIFQQIDAFWGPHTIDLFASGINAQLPIFCTRIPDPQALATNAFTIHWAPHNGWINPPFILLPDVLQKIEAEHATATLLAPVWPNQPWFSKLLSLLIDFPVLLPHCLGTFEACPYQTEPFVHLLAPDGRMATFRASQYASGFSPEVIRAAESGWRDPKRLHRADLQFRTWMVERHLDAIIHKYILENTPPRLEDWDLRLTTKILAYLLKEGLAGRSSDVQRADRCSIRPSSEDDKFRMIDLIRPKDTHASDLIRKMRRIYFNYTATDSRLDWRAVMRHYESNSLIRQFRLKRPQDDSSCLLTFGGSIPGQKPSVDTITRWVAEILWRAGIPEEFSPHSVRGAVVTAKIRNHLEEELQGIFRSQNNLHTFYDRSGCRVFSREEGRALRQARQQQVWKFRKHGVDKEAEGQDSDISNDHEG